MCCVLLVYERCVMYAGGYAPCTAPYAGGRGGGAMFARGSGGAGGDAVCAARYTGGCGGGLCSLEVLEVLEVPEGMRYVLLCKLDAVEGELCLLEGLEVLVMRCVLLFTLEAVEGGIYLLEVLEMMDVMRCVILRMLEAAEGRLCLPEVLEMP